MTDFCKALKRAKGGPGLDQWCSTELRQLAKIPILSREIAKNFQLWISLQKTPGILKQIKLVYLPKVSKTQICTISVNGLRPITVFSCWWRAFSAMRLDSPRLQTLHNILPKDIACRSSHGPEVQACAADFLLSKWHFGATLDFSLCFDTIDVEMLRDGLLGGFPKDFHNWVLTMWNHWLSCECWVHFNKHVGDKLSPRIGIPQGDPASPLFLTLLLWLGYNRVEQNRPPGNLFQCIWMDDRTIICDNQHLLDTAISRWSEFAKHFHFMENLNKTQTVFPKGNRSMEVLVAIIGKPNKRTFNQTTLNKDRFARANHNSKRIALLPNKQHRLNDLATLTRPAMSYGWIAGSPSKTAMTSYDRTLWKSLGNLSFSPPSLRRIIRGAHLEAKPALWIRLTRLQACRNLRLRQLGLLDDTKTHLDQTVAECFTFYRRLEFQSRCLETCPL